MHQHREPGRGRVLTGSWATGSTRCTIGPNSPEHSLLKPFECDMARTDMIPRHCDTSRQGYETIMMNCNPETVSTDYDTSTRLYFEPITGTSAPAPLGGGSGGWGRGFARAA